MSATNSLGYSVYELDDAKGWVRVSMIQTTAQEARDIMAATSSDRERMVYETVMHAGKVV